MTARIAMKPTFKEVRKRCLNGSINYLAGAKLREFSTAKLSMEIYPSIKIYNLNKGGKKMKKIIPIVIALIALNQASAVTIKDCRGISAIAGKLMEQRQDNADAADMYERMPESYHNLVDEVYQAKLYYSEYWRDRVAKQFKNKVFLDCRRHVK